MNKDLNEMEQPGRTGLTTAVIAHADEKSATIDSSIDKDFDRADKRGARHADSDEMSDLMEESPASYPPASDSGVSDRTSRTLTGNPAGIQSARESATVGSSHVADRSQVAADSDRATPLFSGTEANGFNSRWDSVQVAFVDEPRQAVEKADELVASAMKRLAEVFAEERARLEEQWDRGDSVSTEDLRVALQRYRSFFRRLLAV